ncbi:MAG TPA: GspH/FimT family pseudopilin [Methylomirabilota bacterium]|jgi:prepilin-type N-terminal cleavage/methylation domain-containing protein|nr:GspH/FimT family pseudopilin [Methylomirabilota bacterium]
MWRSASRGFTLLELIVTLFVILLTVGLSVPLISRSSDAIRARADIAGFSAVLRHARERAITSRRAYAVVIDPTTRKMTVFAGGTDGEVKETRTLPERVSVQANPPPALTVRFEPEGTSSGAEYRVTAGDIVYRVSVDPVTGRVKNTRL